MPSVHKGFKNNNYEIRGEVTALILKNKKGEIHEALVDTEDLQKLIDLDCSWHLKWDKVLEQYYAKTAVYYTIDGQRKATTLHLHSVIIDYKENHIHHKNHNTLDNRKFNLEEITVKENLLNRKGKNITNKSGYRNVCWDKRKGYWIVTLCIDGKSKRLGNFNDVHEAGAFAQKMRDKYYGKYYK